MRILYVEDDAANVALVERVAGMSNHDIISYPHAEDALANFEFDNPHLVIADIHLAGDMTGLEMTAELRAAGYNTPIIAVTAYHAKGVREMAFDAGCDEYFEKPIPVPDIIRMMEQ